MKDLINFLIITLLAISSCTTHVENTVVQSGIELTPEAFSQKLKDQFETDLTEVCKENLHFHDTLKSIYANRNYEPLWWNALLGDSSSWAKLEETFIYGQLHGMNKHYYHLPIVDYYRKEIEHSKTADSAYQLMAKCEVLVSNGLLQLYEDIANGRTDPADVYGYTYMLPRNNLKEWAYSDFLLSDNHIEELSEIHEDDRTYKELLAVLKYYLAKNTQERSSAIDFSDHPKIELGDSTPIISLIIAKLKSKNLPDADIHQVPDTNVYTRALHKEIKKLQAKYNLTPDGIMGYKTYRLINATPSDKINQIRANLERQRWFDKPQKGPFVYVNMPKYDVDLHWKDSVKSFRVCIGKNLPDNYDAMVREYTDSGWLYKLPKNMETPQIASNITYMMVNPTWTIPYSIIKREMWWKLVKDPSYLSRSGYKVFRGKEEINGDTIQWSRINKNKIPYHIVQNPGPENALGTVKYMFNNPFSIYLHDTPSKSAFGRTQRAVSHGCVRLQKPILFGEFLMQNSNEYDADDFRIMMGYPPRDPSRLKEFDPNDSTALVQKLEETTKIRLDKPMPLYLDYRTVYYDEDWQLHFAYDIYDQNKLITQAMEWY